tara:strand:- start:496 stop:1230 length:735 start_codon:yes stop_codon:yes gene_type:complete
MDLKNSNILITGAAGSFGVFLCEYFLNKCSHVIAVDIDLKGLDSLDHNNLLVFKCDLTDIQEVDFLVNSIEHKISILLNLAGYIYNEPLINLLNRESPSHSFEGWKKTLDLNMTTCFNISSKIAANMVKHRTKGIIINISSISAQGNIGQTAYSAAKAGIEAMTKVWAKELGPFKIRSICIAPGFIDSVSTKNNISENVALKYKKQIPIGRFGSLNELADCIKMVIENDFINGKIISIDGGQIV